MDTKVREQILAVRTTGKTNMFDVRAVLDIALFLGFDELAEYLPGHKAEYCRFILTGETE